jgi:16S rRNA (uracil1498-N3)-methyltransferase
MQLFYTPDINSDQVQLSEEESKHCIRVLRKKPGDIIHLCDGKGTLFEAELINADNRKCDLKVIKTISNHGKRDYNIHIAIAPTKNINRFEWFIEKATELGIDEITPLICDNSERKHLNNKRIEKILVSAMKQSVKAYLPMLNEVISFKELVSQDSPSGKYIAYLDKEVNKSLLDLCKKSEDVLILIGPEGDFCKEEIELAKQNGYSPISLGKSRLRTETAGVVACHLVHVVNF